MKAEIHPEYKDTKFSCACGSTFTSKSTLGGDVHTDICSACHPFYIGQQKLVDTGGRIDKFRSRFGASLIKSE